jgi:hypothetical protein
MVKKTGGMGVMLFQYSTVSTLQYSTTPILQWLWIERNFVHNHAFEE